MFNAMPSAELSAATFASSRLTEAARSPTIIKTLMVCHGRHHLRIRVVAVISSSSALDLWPS